MKTKRIWLIAASLLIVSLLVAGYIMKNRIQNQVKDLFKMNQTLQEEGYYMAEFEFRVMNVLYLLDKGKYLKALSDISAYHQKLSEKTGLIKIPEFETNIQEANFYINLQNQETGAFVDESAPYFIYWPITENVLEHIEALLDTVPVKLKYPLKFLDRINTPEKLEVYLNDLAYVGWLAPKFPMTSFVFVRGQLNCVSEDNVLERNKLYHFSSEWKHAFLKWMYDFQDAETGMWGPKYRKSKKMAVKDLDNTASLLKQFRDNYGNNKHSEFPLKYGDKLFESTLHVLRDPFPDDDDLAEIHAWNLKISKGINMLLRYLWNDAPETDKNRAREVFTEIIKVEFEKFYVKNDGAFSYYPNAEHATCDGMTNFKYDDIGALSFEKQKKYWGDAETIANNLGTITIGENLNAAFTFLDTLPKVNSIRIYTSPVNFKSLADSVWAVIYPKPTHVLDLTEVVPNIISWSETSDLSMGNWKSMADIQNQFAPLNIRKPLIYRNGMPYAEIGHLVQSKSEIYLVGFDVLQLPQFVVKFESKTKI